ncbi:portal protein [Henriciella sp.]|uniref:portal protein n=1 Tax=Henriciella sp. TaxID=1968823 RepID=UPI002614822A|nr:portal protein [Henriciella sp.]
MAYDSHPLGGAGKARKLYQQLDTERSPWLTHWVELADHMDPMLVRRDKSDRNQGERSRGKIIDNTGTLALNTLQAGMMSGMTSPARPWVRLMLPDPELMEYEPVKEWLSGETKRLLSIFHRSNTYLMLHQIYGQLGLGGTGCSITMDSFERVVDHYTAPLGEFCLAGDFNGRVTTVARKFEKTVEQLVAEFGRENCSQTVRSLYDAGNYYAGIPVIHVIQPRRERDASKRDGRNKPFSSCYIEAGETGENYLREGGYDDFPALCPRWARRSGDIYGTSPAMTVLGDCKQLQHEQLFKGRAIEYQVNPPLQAPTSFEQSPRDMLPGGMNFGDMNTPNSRIQSIWDVPLRLSDLREDIYDVRGRINAGMFADVFRMFDNYGADTNMTATEVAERHEEKMLMLGPVLERLHGELLRPLVENTFARMVETGLTAPPPPELEGRELQVEFVSVLAQAQRAVGTNGIDRFIGSLGVVAQMKPDVLDKFDADQWAEMYSDSLGVDPKMIIGNERVGFIRQARAEREQQEQQMAAAAQQAETASKLGSIDTSGQNGATDVLNMFQGYNSPSAVDV